VGLMGDPKEGADTRAMTPEHSPGMPERALAAIADEARRRWPLEGIRILHRVGRLEPEDPIVLVAVTSRHRGDAFRACELIIDYLKTDAPFWKKEHTERGARWVEARDSDGSAKARWRDGS
ncbi:MAG: molybdenum cofactor biosynthesis protein MoaE, partial [Chromatiaceae bacterium]|nr:molybdenum cofactor biosynthesis protein MoaE [Chromatiaceae bacterium]